jgi:nucleolar protein 12
MHYIMYLGLGILFSWVLSVLGWMFKPFYEVICENALKCFMQEAANAVARKRDIKIRDRILRLSHAKSVDGTPKKTGDGGKIKQGLKLKEVSTPGSKSHEGSEKTKRKAPALSYQGLRASKSGVVKKTKVNQQRPSSEGKLQGKTNETGPSAWKGRQPAVAARKVKQLAKKRKLDASTPENMHKSKKPRK